MTDIANLSYSVDSSGLDDATRALDRNADAAEEASGSAQILEREYQNLSRTASSASSVLSEQDARYRSIAQRAMEWAEASRTANMSERALADHARDATSALTAQEMVIASMGTEQERMTRRVEQMARAEARVAQQQEAAARATRVREVNLRQLLGQIDPTIAKLEQLAELEGRLEQARDLGLIRPEIFDQYQQKLDETRAATLNVGQASDIMTKSIGGLNLQAVQTQQSIASLARALVTGQWGQAQASITSLTARTGLMGGAFTAAGLAIGGAGAAIGSLAVSANSAQRDVSNITNALLVTGNYANMTVDKVDRLTDSLASLQSVTHGGARNALLAVASSGKLAGEQFEMVAAIAARMEAAVGQSLDVTIRKFEEIGRDPVDALLKLNETERFLTRTHLDRIEALIEEGREQDAAAEAARIYADRLDDVATAAERARPHLSRLLTEVRELSSAAWEGAKNFSEFMAAVSTKFSQRSMSEQFGFGGAINFVRDMYNVDPVVPEGVPPVFGVVDSKQESERRSAAQAAERDIQRQIESMYGLDTAVNRLEKSFGALSEARQKEMMLSGEYNRLLDHAMAQDAKKASGGRSSTRGRDLPDFTKRAHDELKKQLEVEARARASFDAMAATLAGPLAEAQYRYGVDLQKLRELARAGVIPVNDLAAAEENLARQYDETKEAIDRRLNPWKQMADDLDFEHSLIKLTNAEREVEIALRYANVDAISEEGKALSEKVRRNIEAIESDRDMVDAMDAVRGAGKNLLSDLARGENPLSALESALDRVHKRITDMISENLMDQLLGKRGDAGGGKFGDWLGGLFGDLFGVDQGAANEAAALSKSAAELTASGTTLLGAATALSASAAALAAAGGLSAGSGFGGDTAFGTGSYSGGGSGGGIWASLFSAAVSAWGGGRAWGGDVREDRMYRVGEFNRPELLNLGRGQQYLIPGDHGRVEPMGAPVPAAAASVNQKIYVQGKVTNDTARQLANKAGQRQRIAAARFGG